jgi:hypothetical protein
MSFMVGSWHGLSSMPTSRAYTCGHCHQPVSANTGFQFVDATSHFADGVEIRVCYHCNRPSYFEGGQWFPAEGFGRAVAHLPDDVEAVWSEARKATASGCDTAAVLLLRKLLMHVAVDLGADPGKNFTEYVDYLAANHVIPPQASGWVDEVRQQGNIQNHEIDVASSDDARDLMAFMEYLLRGLYEFPGELAERRNQT